MRTDERDYLDVFEADSFFRMLHSRHVRPGLLLFAIPVILILFIFMAKVTESLSMAQLGLAICQDFGNLVSSNKLACLTEPQAAALMPLFRDWPSIVCLIVGALTPYLVYKQWSGFRDLVPTFQTYSLVIDRNSGADGIEKMKDEVKQVNAFVRRFSSTSITPGLLSLLAVMLILFGTRTAIYPLFSPKAAVGWPEQVAQGWWASYSSNAVLWAMYFAFGYVAIYYIARMNLVGSRVVLAIWRLRKQVRYGVDIDNQDGDYGWKPVRDIFTGTYGAILAHMIGLFCLLLLLGAPGPVLLLPVLLQWVFFLPAYTFVPIGTVVGNIRQFKREQEASVRTQLNAIPAHDVAARQPFTDRLKEIRGLPIVPLSKWPWVIGFSLTFITSAYGMIALALNVWEI